MALTVNTNISSMIVQKNLNAATQSLDKAIERMTTGYKINHAKDNAAGYSISESWKTKLSSIDIALENASMGNDLLSTAEENYNLINNHLQRIRDLTEQASNGTYGTDSLKAIKTEIVARIEEITRIAANTEFNGINLMQTRTSDINLQVGINADSNSIIALSSSLFGAATLNDLAGESGLTATINGWTTATASTIPSMLTKIDKAIAQVTERATKIGAAGNRVDSAIESLGVQSQNLTSSLSTIKDSDVAAESSNYIRSQILQQASATLLATANQAPSIALNLI